MALRTLLGVLLAGAGCVMAAGQATTPDAGSGHSPQQGSPYVLKMFTREVLTDVTVTDKHGNPITGLAEKDFRIFDNGKLETLKSFEEHREQKAHVVATSTSPGIFSNDFLRNPPPQVNVLLFDRTTLRIIDQMYLYLQMKQFVRDLPAGQPVAVFVRSGDMALQLSGFTDDHAELMAAIERAIPKLQQPGAGLADDRYTLMQMAMYLNQVPGRKNLIWFMGGSNLFLNAGAMSSTIRDPYIAGDRQAIYDLLEKERIAIYPVDARGLTVLVPNALQQLLMREDAQATGGAAYLNTNALAQAAQHIVSTDGDYYTLVYSPEGLRNDGKWHRVEVKLAEGKGYELSYRRGYFDDGHNQVEAPRHSRKLLQAGGREVDVPSDRNDPIVFTVQVTPLEGALNASDPPVKRGRQRYALRYIVPARDVHPVKVEDGLGSYLLGWAALAFNRYGSPAAKRMQEVSIRVNEAEVRDLPDGKMAFTETVDLPNGPNYLYLALWDTATERMGTVNAEVDVNKPAMQR